MPPTKPTLRYAQADTDARFQVETTGVALRASPGVERDHDAHTVRMILRDIFDHSGNIIQIAKPQRKTTKRTKAK